MKPWAFVLACTAFNCAQPAHWDLSKPIAVAVSVTMPKRDLVFQAMVASVIAVGGTVDPNASQRITVLDTDEGDCTKGALAWTHIPSDRVIHLCRTKTAQSPYDLRQMRWVLSHEWGHELADKSDHIGGEVQNIPPATNCTSHDVMSCNIACHGPLDDYTQADRNYYCSTGNTIHGSCDSL